MAVTDVVRKRGKPAPVPEPAAEAAVSERLGPAQVLALQRTAGNQAVSRMLQRAVRIDGGAKKVDEAHYTTGPGKAVGSKRLVSSLIADPVKRVFTDQAELEKFANGQTDYIGDVVTASAGTFWYRLPENKMTVLGEVHHGDKGNVPDVIKGLNTSRFMYEPFNELAPTQALGVPTPGTQKRLDEANKAVEVSGQVNRALFNPDLENIVIKALTGTQIARNEYAPLSEADRARKPWKARASNSEYSYGERVALYFAMAIHIAQDLSKHDFGEENFVESSYVMSARHLKGVYVANQAALDAFMTTKDADELIAIYELTAPGGFANLTAITDFAAQFHQYGSEYIQQLGTEMKSQTLADEGKKLLNKPGATITDLSPAREEIMWQKIQAAKGYLLVGMGDAHHRNLTGKLDAAGIPHAFVPTDLNQQKSDIAGKWAA